MTAYICTADALQTVLRLTDLWGPSAGETFFSATPKLPVSFLYKKPFSIHRPDSFEFDFILTSRLCDRTPRPFASPSDEEET